MNTSVAAAIDTLASLLRLSDEGLGERVGMTRMVVNNIRRGKRSIKVDDLEAFARAFDCPISVLLGGRVEAMRWAGEQAEAGVQNWKILNDPDDPWQLTLALTA